ncbi:hypothetical protein [Brevundimonas aurifodinae]|uniref:Uncharacterized protein n=2 Tax=Brevundimonas TaxID=41275 RepID=A0ABV1NPY2_9CAUL|nr:MAG: hypothetical protein B7Z42_08900 [Brevundimonas sp. 12-68-7]OYX32951.1 MAG: hypothetical protein B7Z01_09950 [Brevundimonas subvibrioides]
MMTTTAPRTRRLTSRLLMTSAVAMVLFGQPAEAEPQGRAYDAYASSRYNYCDARILGEFYGTDVEGGKIMIGEKILNGIGTNVPVVLAEARDVGYACAWEDTGYSYNDARVLASIWGFADPYDAKLKAADLFTWGNSQQVRNALGA